MYNSYLLTVILYDALILHRYLLLLVCKVVGVGWEGFEK